MYYILYIRIYIAVLGKVKKLNQRKISINKGKIKCIMLNLYNRVDLKRFSSVYLDKKVLRVFYYLLFIFCNYIHSLQEYILRFKHRKSTSTAVPPYPMGDIFQDLQ